MLARILVVVRDPGSKFALTEIAVAEFVVIVCRWPPLPCG